jgi:two-component system CheB/CheR fusion protein
MQSLNEELQTVNSEQNAKMEDMARMSDDMRNLLNSTEIITVFLDKELNVRRFTSGANKLFKLIPKDVGRPLSDIVSNLLYPGMTEEAQEVLRSLAFSEKEINTTDGRWFMVRIMPYRSLEDVIGGVVITFTEITSAKKLEMDLLEENSRLRNLIEAGG